MLSFIGEEIRWLRKWSSAFVQRALLHRLIHSNLPGVDCFDHTDGRSWSAPYEHVTSKVMMSEHPRAAIAEVRDTYQVASAAYRVLYDGQCEICQGCVSWLK